MHLFAGHCLCNAARIRACVGSGRASAHARRGHGQRRAPSQPGCASGTGEHRRRADIRRTGAIRLRLGTAALPRRELDLAGRRQVASRAPSEGGDVPRRAADHFRGRRLLHHGGEGEPPVQHDAGARGARGHAFAAARDHPAAAGASGAAARARACTLPDHAEARVRRRPGVALAPAQCRPGGLGTVPRHRVRAWAPRDARAPSGFLPQGQAATGPAHLPGHP